MLATKLKHRLVLLAGLFVTILVLGTVDQVRAQWPAIDSGFAVTTNWHGMEVPIGQSVTAWAATTDDLVKTVEFKWLDPDGNAIWNPRLPVFGPYTTPDVPSGAPQEIIDWAIANPGITVWYANDAEIPNTLGDWGVQAVFHNAEIPSTLAGLGVQAVSSDTDTVQGKNSDMIAICAVSIEALPEVPFGTIAILFSWIGILGIFALRRKNSSPRTSA